MSLINAEDKDNSLGIAFILDDNEGHVLYPKLLLSAGMWQNVTCPFCKMVYDKGEAG